MQLLDATFEGWNGSIKTSRKYSLAISSVKVSAEDRFNVQEDVHIQSYKPREM